MDFNAYQKALSSQLRGLECPFPEQEFDERLARVRDGMAREDFGALLLTDPSDIFYLTGYSTFEVSVHVALVVQGRHLFARIGVRLHRTTVLVVRLGRAAMHGLVVDAPAHFVLARHPLRGGGAPSACTSETRHSATGARHAYAGA